MENPFKKIPMIKRIIENNRIGRLDFFFGSTIYLFIILMFLLTFVFVLTNIFNDEESKKIIGRSAIIIMIPPYIYGIYLNIISHIKRFHDINMSGWYYLLTFIPLVNIVVILILIFKSGNEGENRFGPSPKELLDLERKLENNEISKEEYEEERKNPEKKRLDF